MSVKIQINSLAALERLIGGNTELEIEVRKNIVYAFVDKHLKGLADDPGVKGQLDKARQAMANETTAAIARELGTIKDEYHWNTGHSRTFTALNEQVKAKITEAVDKQVGDLLVTRLQEAITAQKGLLDTLVARAVENRVTSEIDSRVRAAVAERMKKIMEAAK